MKTFATVFLTTASMFFDFVGHVAEFLSVVCICLCPEDPKSKPFRGL